MRNDVMNESNEIAAQDGTSLPEVGRLSAVGRLFAVLFGAAGAIFGTLFGGWLPGQLIDKGDGPYDNLWWIITAPAGYLIGALAAVFLAGKRAHSKSVSESSASLAALSGAALPLFAGYAFLRYMTG